MGASGSGLPDTDRPPASRSQPIFRPSANAEPDGERTERAIGDAVLAGDRESFRHLVQRESASVVRASHRILRDLHEAEDVAQEAFVTAYRSLASWRGDGPFGAWLTRIAVRIALRRVGQRKAVTWIDPFGASAPVDPKTDGPIPGLTTGSTSDPATIAMRSERAADIRKDVAAPHEH